MEDKAMTGDYAIIVEGDGSDEPFGPLP